MKSRISKKLSIKKETVANLTLSDQLAAVGGAYPTSLKGDCYTQCESNCTVCFTVCLDCEPDTDTCNSLIGGCSGARTCDC